MSHPKKPPAPARAGIPRVLKPTAVVAQLRAVLVALPKSPKWASSPGVQAAAAKLLTATDALDSQQQAIALLLLQLLALRTSTARLLDAAWLAADQVVASVDAVVDGTPQDVAGFGLLKKGRTPFLVTSDAPLDLRAVLGKSVGDGIWRWKPVRGEHGYLVQHTTDPTNPALWVQVAVTKARFDVTGAPSGQKVFVRVAVIRANGLSVWSDALGLVVR